jgi:hypothetical protein|tara:strand:- start:2404 stop:2919 length:516 start_codon:yes stop_codon:yes gene_type:complete
MPLPKQNPGEDRQKFVSRCMSNPKSKEEFKDTKQRIAYCVKEAREDSKGSLIEDVQDEWMVANATWDDEWDEFVWEIEASQVYDEDGKALGAEYQGRKVTLNKPFLTPKGPKKRSVYVKNEKGNVVKVNFGDPNMKIKKSDPARRKSFRARHNCSNPGPKWKARYWSCKAW